MSCQAILFLVFNRPDTTRKVFETIRKAQPLRLYVASDGPRLEKSGEDDQVREVQKIATKVDWNCEVKTFFRDRNLGCKMAVSSAITWFFKHEEDGIILEDDCVPSQSFFPYCQELLEKYRDDTRIMAISGDNFQKKKKHSSSSYYFSRYPHCWGWATWKRAWTFYDGMLLAWPEIKEERLLGDIGSGEDGFLNYWSRIFDNCYAGKIDSWAYPWTFSCWLQSGMTVLPNVNLVSNIGFGIEATHTKKVDSISKTSVGEMDFPMLHPEYVIRNFVADRYTDKHIFNIVQPSASKRRSLGKMLHAMYEQLNILRTR